MPTALARLRPNVENGTTPLPERQVLIAERILRLRGLLNLLCVRGETAGLFVAEALAAGSRCD